MGITQALWMACISLRSYVMESNRYHVIVSVYNRCHLFDVWSLGELIMDLNYGIILRNEIKSWKYDLMDKGFSHLLIKHLYVLPNIRYAQSIASSSDKEVILRKIKVLAKAAQISSPLYYNVTYCIIWFDDFIRWLFTYSNHFWQAMIQ